MQIKTLSDGHRYKLKASYAGEYWKASMMIMNERVSLSKKLAKNLSLEGRKQSYSILM